ncbi:MULTISPECIES: hypothetical protein [unclassified Rhodococcus (in: high G+C Gram-positive bacteria)]|uniref:hypothetical protein n=1 Tax=unclassified Rhodococcus (in: high G+C Gram-positive bacteria) TaxID=192944 RepID=UPI000A81E227|nr:MULTISPECIES: hypothetical protein [unclassified Rhodococcus (in: high G+C Gram-positive bacteria)]
MLHHQLENPGTGRFLCTSPGRVAIAGDWLANTAYGAVAIAHAAKRNADVLIHLGDFGYAFTDAYLDALDRALDEHDLVLGFVEGNHENFDWLLAQPIASDGPPLPAESDRSPTAGSALAVGQHAVSGGGRGLLDRPFPADPRHVVVATGDHHRRRRAPYRRCRTRRGDVLP